MKRLLLLLLFAVGCAAPPAPVASDFAPEGLRHDAYVLEDQALAEPSRPSHRERVLLEAEWPPVNELSLPGNEPGERTVNRRRSSLRPIPALRTCNKSLAKGEPCRGVPQPTNPAPTGAVILRVAPNGYGAPGLELSSR